MSLREHLEMEREAERLGLMPRESTRVLLYLAGSSREHARVAAIAAKLLQAGNVGLAFDWWSGAAAWCGRDADRSREEQIKNARACIAGMHAAHVVWLLYPEAQSVGAFVELGLALAARKHIVITGSRHRESVFTSLANFRSQLDDSGLVEVERFARVRRLERFALESRP